MQVRASTYAHTMAALPVILWGSGPTKAFTEQQPTRATATTTARVAGHFIVLVLAWRGGGRAGSEHVRLSMCCVPCGGWLVWDGALGKWQEVILWHVFCAAQCVLLVHAWCSVPRPRCSAGGTSPTALAVTPRSSTAASQVLSIILRVVFQGPTSPTKKWREVNWPWVVCACTPPRPPVAGRHAHVRRPPPPPRVPVCVPLPVPGVAGQRTSSPMSLIDLPIPNTPNTPVEYLTPTPHPHPLHPHSAMMEGGAGAPLGWECPRCTFMNAPEEEEACGVCETPCPAVVLRTWACPECTCDIAGNETECQACGRRRDRKKHKHMRKQDLYGGGGGGGGSDWEMQDEEEEDQEDRKLPALPKHSHDDDRKLPPPVEVVNDDDDDVEDDAHLKGKEAFALSLFPEFVTEEGEKAPLQCRCCGKGHSTRALMKVHFVKTHLHVFGEDPSLRNKRGMKQLHLEADEQMARALQEEEEAELRLEQEQEEEEEEEGAGGKEMAKASSDRGRTLRKRKKHRPRREEEEDSEEEEEEEGPKKKKDLEMEDDENEDEEDGGDEEEDERNDGSDSDYNPNEEEEEEENGTRRVNRSGHTFYSRSISPSTSVEAGSSSRVKKRAAPPPLETPQEAEMRKQKRIKALLGRTERILKGLEEEMQKHIKESRANPSEEGGEEEDDEEGEGVPKEDKTDKEGGKGKENDKPQPGGAGAPVVQPSMLENVVLRDYQSVGLSWLLSLYRNKTNGILGDEMGLGKTLQVIALLTQLYESHGQSGPHLVVLPLSVLSSWQDEFARCAPFFQVYTHRGEKEERCKTFINTVKTFVKARKEYRRTSAASSSSSSSSSSSFPAGGPPPLVVLTTYEILLRDIKTLQGGKKKFRWTFLVVDEGHRLKNTNSKLLGVMKRMRVSHRLLLTGTPLQNNLNELFVLLSFVQPRLFKHALSLQEWFDQPFASDPSSANPSEKAVVPARTKRDIKLTKEEEELVLGQLHTVLRPFLLRRTKAEVLASLPAKEERVIKCPLSALQIKLYRLLQDQSRAAAASSHNGSANTMLRPLSTANLLVQLRKVSLLPTHPPTYLSIHLPNLTPPPGAHKGLQPPLPRPGQARPPDVGRRLAAYLPLLLGEAPGPRRPPPPAVGPGPARLDLLPIHQVIGLLGRPLLPPGLHLLPAGREHARRRPPWLD